MWIKVSEDGGSTRRSRSSSPTTRRPASSKALGAAPGDLLLLVADEWAKVCHVLGLLRLDLGRPPVNEGGQTFLWVVDFPLFEALDDDGKPIPAHHPFTMPHLDDWDMLDRSGPELLEVRSQAYDLALNGWELGSGSVRIHRSDIQSRIFDLLGIGPEEAQRKFGFLLDAFRYGAPPHAGFAFGIDRLAALLAGEENIREVIAFPKTQSGTDPLTGAPTEPDPSAPRRARPPRPPAQDLSLRTGIACPSSAGSVGPVSDLFGAAAEEKLASQAPLADRLRPTRLDDIVGQDQVLGPGKPLRVLIEADRLSSVILWGPPGTGKTTLARVIARSTAKAFEPLSAVSATVKDVREVAARARQRLGERGQGTILFLDEVHRFTKSQQDALLPSVEEGLLVLIGATTENPYFEVNPPLLSRSTLFRLQPLDLVAVRPARRARPRRRERRGGRGRAAAPRRSGRRRRPPGADRARGGDRPRRGAGTSPAGRRVTMADAEAALGTKALRYGRDDHYDVISAFIKSIRGSDVDAGLYWLAVMLEAGEDARFIARRLVILASEDVGMADPQAIVVADAAARAVEFVGLPEAQLNLAQAVIHLATAPKSNSVITALGAARE